MHLMGRLLRLLMMVALLGWYGHADAHPSGAFPHSLILSRYDCRDVYLVETVPFTTTAATFTPQQYVDALAARPEMTFSYEQWFWYRDPVATIQGDTLIVNYRDTCTKQSLASAEYMDFITRFSSWFWVPGIHHVRLSNKGRVVTSIGEAEVDQPMIPAMRLFLYNPATQEVGMDWRDDTILSAQATLSDALAALCGRRQFHTDRPTGFAPLLPLGISCATPEYPGTSLANSGGVLHIDLPADFPRNEPRRLAGIVLMLTQFPAITAVRVTFAGQVAHEPFMYTTLDTPITPYDLDLPAQRIQSLLRFSFDAEHGDAVKLETEERTASLTPLAYAQTLARQPAMQWTPPLPNYRLVHPQVAIQGDSLVVRYTVEGRLSMSSCELASLHAKMEAWWWVPGIRDVTLLDQAGASLCFPESCPLERHAPRQYWTYAFLTDQRTMGHIYSRPRSLKEAIDFLARHTLGEPTPTPRVQPLLPVGVRITADPQTITNGILQVDLSSQIYHDDQARLAGIVMMLTQFPEVQAVRFTFGGKTVADQVMHCRLDRPVTPYDLEF